MLARSFSFGLCGIEAYPIEIEVDVSPGLPAVNLVGLADTAIRESKERVKSAIKNSGFSWPAERITVSLAPSDLKKEGPAFDLPIALGILSASGQLDPHKLKEFYSLGELSLDGSLRPVRGTLPIALALSGCALKKLILPEQNARETLIVSEACVFPLRTLKETVEFLHHPQLPPIIPADAECQLRQNRHYAVDFSEVKGQYLAKRAIEVAVSGRHNILMIGPPGSGKTMLAKRIPTIMPDLTLEEALEVTKVHSVNACRPIPLGLVCVRPFRQPHHTISDIAMIGGGSDCKPGEISLAHRGVLFLDELPEFRRSCLEALRQPLEDGSIALSRIRRATSFPAAFMLACAMNPCPCGFLGDPQRACRCSTTRVQKYIGKISGPLLDRIDIHLELQAVRYRDLTEAKEEEPSQDIKSRVEDAQLTQKKRLSGEGLFFNSQMNGRMVKKYCLLAGEAESLLKAAITELRFSARAYDKILKVARTIADLAGSEKITSRHISEAIQYRNLDRAL